LKLVLEVKLAFVLDLKSHDGFWKTPLSPKIKFDLNTVLRFNFKACGSTQCFSKSSNRATCTYSLKTGRMQ